MRSAYVTAQDTSSGTAHPFLCKKDTGASAGVHSPVRWGGAGGGLKHRIPDPSYSVATAVPPELILSPRRAAGGSQSRSQSPLEADRGDGVLPAPPGVAPECTPPALNGVPPTLPPNGRFSRGNPGGGGNAGAKGKSCA